MVWITTSTLLERLQDLENRPAWDSFIERFRAPIVRFAEKFGLPACDAEDMAQETLIAFADAYRRGNYDRSQGRLSKWLFGIAYRQLQNARRRRARQLARGGVGVETTLLANLPDVAAAEDSWNETWHKSCLEDCLSRVRLEVEPATYQAFELSVRDARPAAEVARELGVSVKAVYNAKHRLLKRLRQLCEEYEGVV